MWMEIPFGSTSGPIFVFCAGLADAWCASGVTAAAMQLRLVGAGHWRASCRATQGGAQPASFVGCEGQDNDGEILVGGRRMT